MDQKINIMEKEDYIKKMGMFYMMENFVKVNLMDMEYYMMKIKIFYIMGLGQKTKEMEKE